MPSKEKVLITFASTENVLLMARRNKKQEALRRLDAIGIDNLIDDEIKPRKLPDPSNPKAKLKKFQKPATPILPLEKWDEELILLLDKLVLEMEDNAKVKRQLSTAVHTRHHSHRWNKNVLEILACDVARTLKNRLAYVEHLEQEQEAEAALLQGQGPGDNEVREAEAALLQGQGPDNEVREAEAAVLQEQGPGDNEVREADDRADSADVQEAADGHDEEPMVQVDGPYDLATLEESYKGDLDTDDTHDEHIGPVYGQDTLDAPEDHSYDGDDEMEDLEDEDEMYTENNNSSGDEEMEDMQEKRDTRGEGLVSREDSDEDSQEASLEDSQDLNHSSHSSQTGHEDDDVIVLHSRSVPVPDWEAKLTIICPDRKTYSELRLPFQDTLDFFNSEDNTSYDHSNTYVAFEVLPIQADDDAAAEAAYNDMDELVAVLKYLNRSVPIAEDNLHLPTRKMPVAHLCAARTEAKDALRQAMAEAEREEGSKATIERAKESLMVYERADFEWSRNKIARQAQMEYNDVHAENGLVLSLKMKELFESVVL